MRVLGIDPGVNVGWSVFDGSVRVTSGSWNYEMADCRGLRWELYRGDLITAMRTHSIEAVACERPGVLKTWAAIRSVVGTTIVTEQVAGALRLPFSLVSPSTLKKLATGYGRGPKADMVGAAFERWGVKVRDHEADALFVGLHLGSGNIPPRTARRRVTRSQEP